MIINVNKIRNLLASDITGYRVNKLVGITQQAYDNYKKGKTPVKNMTLETAEELMKLINMEEKSMYKLIAKEEGALQSVENFDTFEEFKNHLIENDYFSWIHDEEPEKELPNFEEVEDVKDIQSIFEEYDYSWWTMELEVNEDL